MNIECRGFGGKTCELRLRGDVAWQDWGGSTLRFIYIQVWGQPICAAATEGIVHLLWFSQTKTRNSGTSKAGERPHYLIPQCTLQRIKQTKRQIILSKIFIVYILFTADIKILENFQIIRINIKFCIGFSIKFVFCQTVLILHPEDQLILI